MAKESTVEAAAAAASQRRYLDFALSAVGKDDDNVAIFVDGGDETGLIAVLMWRRKHGGQ
jgi:hypothetical protein